MAGDLVARGHGAVEADAVAAGGAVGGDAAAVGLEVALRVLAGNAALDGIAAEEGVMGCDGPRVGEESKRETRAWKDSRVRSSKRRCQQQPQGPPPCPCAPVGLGHVSLGGQAQLRQCGAARNLDLGLRAGS